MKSPDLIFAQTIQGKCLTTFMLPVVEPRSMDLGFCLLGVDAGAANVKIGGDDFHCRMVGGVVALG